MPEILKIADNSSAESVLSRAAEIILKGGIVAYPTETFYGLGAAATNERAIHKIYDLKGRNFSNPIAVIIAAEENLTPLVSAIPLAASRLMESFWPGPLTIIFKASAIIPSLLTAGTGKIGVRISSHKIAQDLARKIGQPLTATSANKSGMPECRTADEVVRQIGDKIDAIIDGGTTPGGKGSTMIDVASDPLQILREGAIDRLAIGKCLDTQ